MGLAKKLAKLKEQQAKVEQQMAQEVAKEDAVALAVFSRFVGGQPQAVQAMTNSKYAKELSKRDRALLDKWVQRIDSKTSATVATVDNDSQQGTPTGTTTTQQPHAYQ